MHLQSAIKNLIGLLSALIVFHVCIISKIIPHQLVWGGRLQTDNELMIFESVSILFLSY